MKKSFSFRCTTCGETHEGAPSFSVVAPAYHRENDAKCELTSDFCIVDGQYFFIRAILDVPIIDFPEPFGWGIWVSLKHENFERYREIFDEPVQEGSYFGWFSNRLPWYPNTLNLPTTVHLQSGGNRPWVELDRGDHPLRVDYHAGISMQRAREIAQAAMHEHGT